MTMRLDDDKLIFSFEWVVPVMAASKSANFLGLPLHVRSSPIFKMTHNELTYQWRMSIRSRLDTKQSWLTLHYVSGPTKAVACRFQVQVPKQATGECSAEFYARFDYESACDFVCNSSLTALDVVGEEVIIELKMWLPILAFCPRSLGPNEPPSSSTKSLSELTIGGVLSKLPEALFDFEFVTENGSVRCPRYLLYAFAPSMKRRFDERFVKPLEASEQKKTMEKTMESRQP